MTSLPPESYRTRRAAGRLRVPEVISVEEEKGARQGEDTEIDEQQEPSGVFWNPDDENHKKAWYELKRELKKDEKWAEHAAWHQVLMPLGFIKAELKAAQRLQQSQTVFTPRGGRVRTLPLPLRGSDVFSSCISAVGDLRQRYHEFDTIEEAFVQEVHTGLRHIVMAPIRRGSGRPSIMWPSRILTQNESAQLPKSDTTQQKVHVDEVCVELLFWANHRPKKWVEITHCSRVTVDEIRALMAAVQGSDSSRPPRSNVLPTQRTLQWVAGLSYALALAELDGGNRVSLYRRGIANDVHVPSFTTEQLENPWGEEVEVSEEDIERYVEKIGTCDQYSTARALGRMPEVDHVCEERSCEARRAVARALVHACSVPDVKVEAEELQDLLSVLVTGDGKRRARDVKGGSFKKARNNGSTMNGESSERSGNEMDVSGASDSRQRGDPKRVDVVSRSSSAASSATAAAQRGAPSRSSGGGRSSRQAFHETAAAETGSSSSGHGDRGTSTSRSSSSTERDGASVGAQDSGNHGGMDDARGAAEECKGVSLEDPSRDFECALNGLISLIEHQSMPMRAMSLLGLAQRLLARATTRRMSMKDLNDVHKDMVIPALEDLARAWNERVRLKFWAEANALFDVLPEVGELEFGVSREKALLDVLRRDGKEKVGLSVADLDTALLRNKQVVSDLEAQKAAHANDPLVDIEHFHESIARFQATVKKLYSAFCYKKLKGMEPPGPGVVLKEYVTAQKAWGAFHLALRRTLSDSQRTVLMYCKLCHLHSVPDDHSERVERLQVLKTATETLKANHPEAFEVMEVQYNGDEKLHCTCDIAKTSLVHIDCEEHGFTDAAMRVHDIARLKHVRDACRKAGSRVTHVSRVSRGSQGDEGDTSDEGDTYATGGSWTAVTQAFAATHHAVDLVLDGKARNAFVIARPPAHHAVSNGVAKRPVERGDWGFCLINHVAAAAKSAVEKGLNRVTIIDIDLHHGNGTQDILCRAPTRFYQYVSTHAEEIFPNTGSADVNKHPFVVNLPLKQQFSPDDFWCQWKTVVTEVRAFGPNLIIVSAGFDAHKNDPVRMAAVKDPEGKFGLEARDYYRVMREIGQLADELCGGQMVALVEGGYGCNTCTAMPDNTRIAGTREGEGLLECFMEACRGMAGVEAEESSS